MPMDKLLKIFSRAFTQHYQQRLEITLYRIQSKAISGTNSRLRNGGHWGTRRLQPHGGINPI
ncbi:hypothetical protein APA02_21340 [Pseudomonas aeruginosa]|uniref:Uncharacterized protein n=1 Tax=Pseudomonas putida TaxID=303 RepID=A0A1X1A6K5_PSEPU|nr:hypothetical protein AO929_25155 [Pseudomonas aeruginosa]OFM67260.1 hypothetical protein HMPREF2670_27480 [Pseudomonas sp. HMSC072F09]OFM80799.1 hypothetical protein HMPREF2666_08340 [Pseudomonas sp. HMSC058C05]ORL67553.1 hypothetical protein B7H17_00385 [Pseudomonas putida]KSJ79455.1 hypothetical protein APA02_21340 [Pseudomonas aeruginosa]